MQLRKENAFIRSLPDEDRILAARLADMLNTTERNYSVRFTLFLDERQCALAEGILRSLSWTDFNFWGGYNAAQRRMLAIFPPDFEPDEAAFPLLPLECLFRKTDSLSHRDFLGAILSHGIKRDVLGDILVSEGKAVVFVSSAVSDMLMREVEKIGSVGVKIRPAENTDFNREEKFVEISGTVASLRIDSIFSLAAHISREKSAALIESAGIEINHEKSFSVSRLLAQEDVFSARGFGKFILSEIGGLSKKGKTFVCIKKYM